MANNFRTTHLNFRRFLKCPHLSILPLSRKKTIGGLVGYWKCPGVNCQEATREELIDTLKTTLKEYMAEDLAAFSTLSGYEQVPIQL